MVLVAAVSLVAAGGRSAGADTVDEAALREFMNAPQTGDLAAMRERGFVRMLTTYNPLHFTYDGIEQRGIVVETARAFEAHLNQTSDGKATGLHVVLIPVARDELLPSLRAGRGDVVSANLTVTPARRALVAFSDPTYPDVRELVVTGPAARGLRSLDDLTATTLHVRESSSYSEHLAELNGARSRAGKPEIPVRKADERLEDYDLLEMVNAGLLPAVVVDGYKARLWAQVFDDIEVHDDMVIHSGGSLAWAVRSDSPELLKELNAFVKTVRKGTLLGNVLIKRYYGSTKWIDNVYSEKGRERYRETIDLIKRYADLYEFDWLMLTAQAYQESKLDQSTRSRAGAIGIMQVLPSTAADRNVDISNIEQAEQNVHAGTKYLRFLRSRYFSSNEIAPLDRVLFSFAAYNAGPRNIGRARERAIVMGFDPNKWFGNVEVAAAKTISREPVVYVRNIYKYYIAYKQLEERRLAREAALSGLE